MAYIVVQVLNALSFSVLLMLTGLGLSLVLSLAAQGLTIVLVEQHLALSLRVAQRAVVLAQGGVAYAGSAQALAADAALQHRLLGV